MNLTKEQLAAIAEAVTRLERDLYGRGPSSVRVSSSGDNPRVVTVLSVDSLTTMDRTLAERDKVQAVVAHHQAVGEATSEDFIGGIEVIVERRPDVYLAQVDPETGYAVRVFLFAEDGDSG
ncbi:MAG: Na-translocating system protein MpsC family protein [Egibacteraceae bacterium]